jgi:hypothetical protein
VPKALATFGTGPAADLLGLALPTFVEYATRHGYDLVVGDGEAYGRPASWGKIPLIQRLLQCYEFVLWIDADALILDASTDLETEVPSDAFQAFVITRKPAAVGSSPCCGVWAFRAGSEAQRFLDAVWSQEDLIDHYAWEQAAVMRLTGWTIEAPYAKARSTAWDRGTHFLDEEWDMIPQLPIGYRDGKIRHYAGWSSYRRRKFDMTTDLAAMRGEFLRYRLGLVERRGRPVYAPVRAQLREHVQRLLPTRARRYR